MPESSIETLSTPSSMSNCCPQLLRIADHIESSLCHSSSQIDGYMQSSSDANGPVYFGADSNNFPVVLRLDELIPESSHACNEEMVGFRSSSSSLLLPDDIYGSCDGVYNNHRDSVSLKISDLISDAASRGYVIGLGSPMRPDCVSVDNQSSSCTSRSTTSSMCTTAGPASPPSSTSPYPQWCHFVASYSPSARPDAAQSPTASSSRSVGSSSSSSSSNSSNWPMLLLPTGLLND